jgi:hypothetical protein
MSTPHFDIYWTAGDDWQIDATLLDETGAPFDLSGTPDIKWALVDAAGARALDETDAIISVTDVVAGTCRIQIPATATSPLAGGNYNDVIRIVVEGVTSTLSYGHIHVTADPWAAAAATAGKLQLVS